MVHDLLAFLAERMLEMNRSKQQEIRGFLGWLEGYVGAKVEDLTPYRSSPPGARRSAPGRVLDQSMWPTKLSSVCGLLKPATYDINTNNT